MTHRAPGVAIRAVIPSDVPALSALIQNTLLISNSHDYDLRTIRTLMAAFSSQAVSRLIRQRQMFVAQVNGRLAGVVALEAGEVYSFFVAPDRQGRGVGRELLAFVEGRAREQGVRHLFLSASLTAVGFYEHLGYRRTGEVSDGRFGRTVRLVKTLSGLPRHGAL